MKKITLLLFVCLINLGVIAQTYDSYEKLMKLPIQKTTHLNGDEFLQGNFTEILTGFSNDSELTTITKQWLAIANAPHPNVRTIRKYLAGASKEFNVPFALLDAIAKSYNNYSMVGPSEYGSYGIMGLTKNDFCNTLSQSAKLIGLDIETVKSNPKETIRAAAALLSFYAKGNKNSKNLIDWFDAVKQYTGLIDDDTREMQAIEFYRVLNNGLSSITLWKETAGITPLNNSKISLLIAGYDKKIETKRNNSKGVDYPGAISEFTSCNYSSRGGTDIDTWVNHYIGTGTIAGALSWFKNCNAQASAHFCLSKNGTVYQSVAVANKAWHAGAIGQPNNQRSIGIEHDVTTSTPSNWNNNTMLVASTDIARYFCDKYSIPKTRSLPGIRGHKEMPGTNTDCPGNLPWTTWMNLLNNGGTPVNTPVAVSPSSGATNIAIPVSFTYTSPVNANAFRIQVSTTNSGWSETNGFTSGSSPTSTIVVNASITGLSFTWADGAAGTYEGPKSNKKYYYTIRSWDSTTGTSKYTVVKSFTTEVLKFEEVWSRSDFSGNMPGWFSSTNSTERGLAYTNDHLYVVSRNNSTNSVKVLNALTGTDIGSLNVSGIYGGTYSLNDVETSWDKQILACNLTTDASTSGFKIYKWENESSVPTLFISYNSSTLRLGDNFTVLGSLTSNAVIYAAAANNNKVLKWVVSNGVLNTTPSIITLQGVTSVGTCPSVTPFGTSPTEDFYINANGITPKQYHSNGTLVGTISSSVVANYSNSIQMLVIGSDRYIITFQSNPTSTDPNGQNARIVKVTEGANNVIGTDVYGVTNRIGDNSNSNWSGDVAYRRTLSPDDLIIYVLSTNNGLAAYRPLGLINSNKSVTEILNQDENNIDFRVYPNPANNLLYIDLKTDNLNKAQIQLVDLNGKIIFNEMSQNPQNEINTIAIKNGVYFLRITTNKLSKTRKIIVNH